MLPNSLTVLLGVVALGCLTALTVTTYLSRHAGGRDIQQRRRDFARYRERLRQLQNQERR